VVAFVNSLLAFRTEHLGTGSDDSVSDSIGGVPCVKCPN
jgi:hypothetical protein